MKSILLMKCETGLHMGTGDEIGIVDMPIQREKHTGFPKMEASGIKGVLLDDFNKKTKLATEPLYNSENRIHIFGAENGQDGAGNLQITDGKLLFLPVRTGKNVFGWITCPYILNRFFNDCLQRNDDDKYESIISPNNYGNIYKLELVVDPKEDMDKKRIIIEEFSFSVLESIPFPVRLLKETDSNEFIKSKFDNDLYVVSDDVFSYFSQMGTEINTRIKIGEDGVAENKALFTEEYLPEQSILYSMIDNLNGNDSVEEYIKEFDKRAIFQFGANASIGKGLTSVIRYGGEK